MQPILKTTLLLAILHHLPSTLADTSCTETNAIPWPQSGSTSTGGDSGGSGSGSTTTTDDDGCSAADLARDDTGCVNEYCTTPGSTAESLNVCFCLALGGCDTTTTTDTDDFKKRGATAENDPRQKRAGFACSSSETCFFDSDAGELFCLDLETGDYVGEDGESGNAYTGDSGADDGSTAAATATATDDGESTTTSVDSSSASETATTTKTTSSGKSANSASSATATTTKSASATAASTTIHSAGAARVTAGAVVGALAFAAVGFAL